MIDLTHNDLKLAIARQPLLTIKPEAEVTEVVSLLSKGRGNSCELNSSNNELTIIPCCVFVVESGVLKGIITEKDIVKWVAEGKETETAKVRDIMTSPVISFPESELTNIFEIVNLFQKNRIRHLPITDENGQVIGCITNNSLRQVLRSVDLLRWRTVEEVMTREIIVTKPSTSLLEIAKLMLKYKVSSIIITEKIGGFSEGEKPLGIITEKDIVQFKALDLNFKEIKVERVMSTPLISISPIDILKNAFVLMQEKMIQRLVVTGKNGELLGIITQSSVLKILNPNELYDIISSLETKVKQLEAEKLQLLENRTLELETLVQVKQFQLSQKEEQEKLINNLVSKIKNTLDLSIILDTAVKEIKDFLLVDRVLICQNHKNNRCKLVAEAVEIDLPSALKIEIEDNYFYNLYQDHPTINNINDINLTINERNFLASLNVKANLMIPILSEKSGSEWGLIIIQQCSKGRNWSENEKNLLEQIAAQIAIAIQQAKILKERQKIEYKWRSFAENSPNIIFTINREGIIIDCNRYFQDTSCENLREKSFDKFIDNYFQNNLKNEIKKGLQGEIVSTFEGEYLANNGNIYYYQIQIIPVWEVKEITELMVIFIDITETKKQDLAIKNLSKLLQTVVNSVNAGITLSNSRGEFIFYNDYMYQLTGYTGLEARNSQDFLELLYPDRPEFVEALTRIEIVKNKGYIYNIESNIHCKKGEQKTVLISTIILEENGEKLWLSIYHDISERKEAEKLIYDQLQELNKWQNRYQIAGLASGQIIYEYNFKEHQLIWGENTEKILGYTREKMPQNREDFLTLIHPEDQSKFLREIDKSLKENKTFNCEYRLKKAAETYIWVKDNNEYIVNYHGEKVGVIGLLTDITKEKEAKIALKESEGRFRQLAENIRQVFYLTDLETNQLLYLSPSYETIWQRSCQELLDYPRSYIDYIYPNDRPIAFNAYQRQRQGETTEEEYRISRPSGELRWILDRTFPVKNEQGEVYRVCGIAEDITERKEIELALKASEDKFQQISLSSPEVIYILVRKLDGSFVFEYISEAVSNFAEITRDQVLENSWNLLQLVHEEDREKYEQAIAKSATTLEGFDHEWRIITPSGQLKWLKGTFQPKLRENGEIAWYGVVSNITRQKEAEIELKRLQERLSLVLKGSNDGWWDWDLITNEVYISDRWWEMLGYSKGELPSTLENWQQLIHPEDLEKVNQAVTKSMENPQIECSETEYRMRHKDGHYVPVLSRGYTLRNEQGQPIRNTGTNTDLTILKQKEISLEQALNALQELNDSLEIQVAERTKELKESEERWHLALLGANDGIWDWNLETNEVFFSPRWKEMLGYNTDEITNDLAEWSKRVHPNDLPLVQNAINAHFTGETEFYTNEHRLLCKDGSYKWILTRGKAIRNNLGDVLRMVGSHTDISDRKLAETKLLESEQRFRRVFDSNVVGMMFTDHYGLVKEANDRFLEMIGYTREDLETGQINWQLLTPPEHSDKDIQAIENLQRDRVTTPWEKEYYRKDGSKIAVIVGVAMVSDSGDDSVCIVVDISDRQKMEQELRFSEQRFRRYFEQSLIGMAITSPDKGWVDINERLSEILGYSKTELQEMTWAEMTHPEDLEADIANFNRVVTGEIEGYEMDKRFIHQDGHIIYAQISVKCLRKNDGSVDFFIAMIQDISDRHFAEIALKESESRYRRIVETANEGIWIIDANSQTTFVNQKMADLLKISLSELMGKTPQDFVPPEFQEYVAETIDRRQQGIEEKTETPLVCADGSIIWILSSNTPIFDDDGNYIGALAMVTDISDRKKVEQELVNLSTRLELAIQSAEIGIWERNIKTEELFWDERVFDLYGLEPEEFENIQSAWFNRVHPEDQVSCEKTLEQALENSYNYEDEFRIILPDGTIRYIKSFALIERDQEGNPQRMIGVNYDITPIKEAEIKWRESEKRYRALMEKASDAILLADLQGNLIEVNQKACELLGYSKEELRKMHISQIHPPENIQVYQETFDKVSQQESGYFLDAEVIRKDGTIIPVDITGSVIPWGNSNIQQGIFRDITERKRAEMQLKESYDKLAQTNVELARATRLKDEFLANMSHELRTPLNAILGLTEALQEETFGPLNERQLHSLQTVQRSGNHLLDLINDILDLAKIASGKIEIYPTTVTINHLCDSSLVFIKHQALQKQIKLNLDLAPHLPAIFVDEKRIRQVLINLLNNAVKFTPEQGNITLRVSLTEDLKFVRFAVVDTGIGIAPENISKLFQPFTQIDSALNRQYTGTGLGLALVKQIVDLHGGHVSLESQLGVGSTFMVDLPLPECPLPLTQPTGTNDNSYQQQSIQKSNNLPLILLAEDNEANIGTISSYLEAKDYKILIAKNGQEAIDKCFQEAPDLILMDIQMPEVDGLEAIKRIRQNPQFTAVPIIALTALAMESDRQKCLEAGANEYISKPVRLRQLVMTIQQLIMDSSV